jgi:tRNA pseudouridine38-40 synthase
MPRYKLTIAYDGTDFCGWQKQLPPDETAPPPLPGEDRARTELRTVQGVLERAVREAVREPVIVTGASRTDSGVHAWGQCASFLSAPDTDKGVGWPADRGLSTLVRAINGKLPRDVLVRDAQVVPDDFDPISGAIEKEYTYTFAVGYDRPLWDRRFVFHTWHELDAGPMAEAARHLIGEHDFAAFAQINHGRRTTVRRIFNCSVEDLSPPVAERGGGGRCRSEAQAEGGNPAEPHPADPLVTPTTYPPLFPGDFRRIRVRVSGSGFLYNMVRILAGTLMEVGRGKIDPNHIPAILESKDRRANHGPTLPPQGLRLEWVRYG